MIKWLRRLQWEPRSFYIAGDFNEGMKVLKQHGFAYKGLAIHQLADADCWTVTHLGTGHRMMGIYGNADTAKDIAGELARAADWHFNELPNKENPAYEKLRYVRMEILNKHRANTFIHPIMNSYCAVGAAAAYELNKKYKAA